MPMNIDKKEDKTPKRGIGLGVFDGLHIGHKELVFALVEASTRAGLQPTIFTFRYGKDFTMPKFRQGDNCFLTCQDSKIEILKSKGVKEIVYQDFTEEFSQVEAEDFLDEYMRKQLNAGLIVVGHDFRFGKKAKGNIDTLRAWGAKNRVEIIVIDELKYAGEPVSSSRIRAALKEGRLDLASSMLGSNYRLSGTVIKGRAFGRKLGFPTANFYPAEDMCLPKNGIYVTRTYVDNTGYDSVTNIGLRPSVDDSLHAPIAETYLLDKNLDLYGKDIEVEFLARIRGERKFESVDLLKAAILKDVEFSKNFHRNPGDYYLISAFDDIKIKGVKTDSFATAIVNITAALPLTKKSVSLYRLLSNILTVTCAAYPSRNSYENKLASLYGALISCTCTVTGDALFVEFALDALQHMPGGDYSFKDSLDFFFSVLTEPDLDEAGKFRQDIVAAEKNNLVTEILARENDKMRFSLDKAFELFTKDTVYEIRSFGDADLIAGASDADLKEAYESLFKDAHISLWLAGNYDFETASYLTEKIKQIFKNNRPVKKTAPGFFPLYYAADSYTAIEETLLQDVEQAKICKIYYDARSPYSSFGYKSILLNQVFGGGVDSLLFRIVREEMELAYSVFSVSNREMNILLALAGVDNSRTSDALDAIDQQLDRIKNMDFPPSLAESGKNLLISNIRQVGDSLSARLSFAKQNYIKGTLARSEDKIAEIEAIRKEEICEEAGKYREAVTFVLTGKSKKK